MDAAIETGALDVHSTITAVREHLQVHPDRARALHKHLQDSATTPPQLSAAAAGEASSPSAAEGTAGEGAP